MTTKTHALQRDRLRGALERVRLGTLGLIDPLDHDDLHKQFDRIMSPVVWDVGHVGNFEEWWLLRKLDGRPAHDEALDRVYNPFDNPRWVRANLPILPRDEAVEYLRNVRGEAMDLMRKLDLDPREPLLAGGYVWRMTVQHEAQHQETVLQALDLRTDLAPYSPAAAPLRPAAVPAVDDTARMTVSAGDFVLGTDDRSAAYDNERPAHRVHVDGFAIDKYPVTVRRFAEFVAAGGYHMEELWSEEGRRFVDETGHEWPQGWLPDLDGGWLVRRFGHVRSLDPADPVQHVSFWEAEAFAAWAGGALPTEAEWEKAARWNQATGVSQIYPWGDSPPSPELANVGAAAWGPVPVGSLPAGASPCGAEQMLGDVYEWTTTFFEGYPGYVTFPYPEYSEVFFGSDYRVLRGASWATSPRVARATFRNWDYPQRRQIFAGLRLAWPL